MQLHDINLLHLLDRDTELKRVASTGGGEWHGVCPFCGGKDRFIVQPDGRGWSCRQCSPHWSDAAGYIMRRHNCTFPEALAILNIPLEDQPMHKGRSTVRPSLPPAVAPTPDWTEAARDFCRASFDALWSTDGVRARKYLAARGIDESLAEGAGLGYSAEDRHTVWGKTEVFLPRGIVIPWVIDGAVHRVNIRRPVGDPKYLLVKGSRNALYNGNAIEIGDTVVMVEGEFDCLLLKQVRGIVPVATGSTTGSRQLRWVSLLKTAGQVVIAYDQDELTNSGVAKAVQYWMSTLGNLAVRLLPTEHDITDMGRVGRSLQEWLAPYSLLYERDISQTEYDTRERIARETVPSGYVRIL